MGRGPGKLQRDILQRLLDVYRPEFPDTWHSPTLDWREFRLVAYERRLEYWDSDTSRTVLDRSDKAPQLLNSVAACVEAGTTAHLDYRLFWEWWVQFSRFAEPDLINYEGVPLGLYLRGDPSRSRAHAVQHAIRQLRKRGLIEIRKPVTHTAKRVVRATPDVWLSHRRPAPEGSRRLTPFVVAEIDQARRRTKEINEHLAADMGAKCLMQGPCSPINHSLLERELRTREDLLGWYAEMQRPPDLWSRPPNAEPEHTAQSYIKHVHDPYARLDTWDEDDYYWDD